MIVKGYTSEIEGRLQAFDDLSAVERIWNRDFTLWKPVPEEISNRLGWLDLPQKMPSELHRLVELANITRQEGIRHLVLLGMGGSSLAPEVFARTFGSKPGFPKLLVLDSTHPERIRAILDQIEIKRSIFLVSSKSGSTVETQSFFKFMYSRVMDAVGKASAGAHFIAITDPGSSLVTTASNFGFRELFQNDPAIGGRYSALSFFGLVPAALVGVDTAEILLRAQSASDQCRPSIALANNPSAVLGAAIGEMALKGRDKLTIIIDEPVISFGNWIEQLVAESMGKEGKGILPIVNEPTAAPDSYGEDRFFVWLHMAGSHENESAMSAIQAAGQPVLELPLQDKYNLGSQIFFWEMAIALSGQVLGINPFDQPNVESAKIRAREMLESYQETGSLPALSPDLQLGDIEVFLDGRSNLEPPPGTIHDLLSAFINGIAKDGYLAVQAYLDPSPENESALRTFRDRLQHLTSRPITLGFGPRFLHSTGQLHKGDGGKGRFLQITDVKLEDFEIPDQAGEENGRMTFGVMIDAQAQGDRQALLDAGRVVIRLHLPVPIDLQLSQLIAGS